MVGDKVPSGDNVWINYLNLLDIVDILMAQELTENDLPNLATLILDHHQQFKLLHPNTSVTIKMYYIMHILTLSLE